jgi:predicted nucleotidyltransferase
MRMSSRSVSVAYKSILGILSLLEEKDQHSDIDLLIQALPLTYCETLENII